MNFVALPLLGTLLATAGGSALWARLHPAFAARVATMSLLSVLLAAVPTFWLVGLSGLTHLGASHGVFDWSHHLLPSNTAFSAVFGLSSLALAVIGTIRAARVLLAYRRQRCTNTPALEIVASEDVFAFTLPGPARSIAVSSALRDALDTREFDVVLAHEQTHARYRHDLLLLLANTTRAFVPLTKTLATRFEFLLERWADEEASDRTGCNRRFVATTIAKVAVSVSPPVPALGIASHGAAARAEALLIPVAPTALRMYAAVWLFVALAVSQSVSQIHHTAEFGLRLLP